MSTLLEESSQEKEVESSMDVDQDGIDETTPGVPDHTFDDDNKQSDTDETMERTNKNESEKSEINDDAPELSPLSMKDSETEKDIAPEGAKAEPSGGSSIGDMSTSGSDPSNDSPTDQIPADEPAAASEPTRIISNPPKKGRTAYFIFMSENRSKVQSQNEGKSVGAIAKIMGQLWKDLDPDAKQVYMDKSLLEKERYLEDQRLFLEQNPGANTSNSNDANANGIGDPMSLVYPVARIRKISRLDPEVKGMSKEATFVITKAAELFTERFGNETNSMAQMQKRRKILNQDLVDVVNLKEPFFFLKEDLLDLVKLQQKQASEDSKSGKGKKSGSVLSEKAAKAVANTRPLTSFFKSKK